jgi:Uma2 family endonuclease
MNPLTMLSLISQGHNIELENNALIIIQEATLAQYEQLANEDLKLEFDGVCIYIHSPASYRHEKTAFNLLQQLEAYFQKNASLGDDIGSHFSVKLPSGKRVEPDILIIPPNSVSATDSVFEGVPSLIIEILSPSTREYDLEKKKEWYFEAKVNEILFLDFENDFHFILYRLNPNGTYREIKSQTEAKICTFPQLNLYY